MNLGKFYEQDLKLESENLGTSKVALQTLSIFLGFFLLFGSKILMLSQASAYLAGSDKILKNHSKPASLIT